MEVKLGKKKNGLEGEQKLWRRRQWLEKMKKKRRKRTYLAASNRHRFQGICHLAPVVQNLDSAIHRINPYADKC